VKPYFKDKLDVVAHTCNPSYLGGGDRKILVQDLAGQKYETPSEIKKNKTKHKNKSAQVIEHLPASTRPWVQSLVPQKEKKEQK
jgi:hypothetical protein